MTHKAVEMQINSGAEALLADMGKRMKTRARSKILDRAITLIRADYHVSEIAPWFAEDAFASDRRTTVRLSAENADYLKSLSQTLGKGRPAVLMGLTYFAAAQLSREDLESLRTS